MKKIILASSIGLVLILIIIFNTGCVCPLFSFVERVTGLKINAGKDIDSSFIASDELIYPGSVALIQLSGDIDSVLEGIAGYGVILSGDEMEILRKLPDKIKQEDMGLIAYSTADKKDKVFRYYDYLQNKGWNISDFSYSQEGLGEASLILAEKDGIKQVLMIAGTDTNSFIIFIDFNWDYYIKSENLSLLSFKNAGLGIN